MLSFTSIAVVLASILPASLAAPYNGSSNSSLPIVDLGYELQQATLYNSTGQYYNFSNIRYAAPPTGDLRFQPPQPPAENRGEVQTGLPGRICAQASPAWELIAAQYVPKSGESQQTGIDSLLDSFPNISKDRQCSINHLSIQVPEVDCHQSTLKPLRTACS